MGHRWDSFKNWNLWPWNWPPIKIYKPITRSLIILAFFIGLAILIVCWTIDLRDDKWWHGHTYIPNIFAGITGFLIGAPVALVVLATFTLEREENTALKRVNRLSLHAWYEFSDAVNNFCTMERIDAMQKLAPEVEKAHDEAFKVVQRYISYARAGGASNTLEFQNIMEAMGATALDFNKQVNAMNNSIGDSGTLEMQWSVVVGAWNILDQYVRLQRSERYLEWFDKALGHNGRTHRADADIRRWMSRTKNPLQEFAEVHGDSVEIKHSANTMVEASNAILWYAGYEETKRRELLLSGNGVFGHTQVPNYKARYQAASDFLIRLLGSVSDVDFANWPACASEPVKPELRVGLTTPRVFGQIMAAKTPAEFEALRKRLLAQMASDKSNEPPATPDSQSDTATQ